MLQINAAKSVTNQTAVCTTQLVGGMSGQMTHRKKKTSQEVNHGYGLCLRLWHRPFLFIYPNETIFQEQMTSDVSYNFGRKKQQNQNPWYTYRKHPVFCTRYPGQKMQYDSENSTKLDRF